MHIHHRQHETGYVVEGEFLIRRGEGPVERIGPGTYAHFPMGVSHAFKCVGTTRGKLLFWMTPGGYEGFFAKALELVGSGPPDMNALAALGKAHDVDIIGPMIEETA
jgi:quercetin dioxygenase-like cupin family protein